MTILKRLVVWLILKRHVGWTIHKRLVGWPVLVLIVLPVLPLALTYTLAEYVVRSVEHGRVGAFLNAYGSRGPRRLYRWMNKP